MRTLVFSRETLETFVPDSFPLFEKHYAEICEYQAFPLEPNFQFYEYMEDAKCLRIFTARKDGVLIGYAIFTVGANPHYGVLKKATHDLLFIDPKHRGFGLSFMDWYEEELKKEGVDVIYMTVTTRLDFSKLLLRRNYTLSEWIYSKPLR